MPRLHVRLIWSWQPQSRPAAPKLRCPPPLAINNADEDRALGALYPPLTALQDTAASVAAAVAAVAYHAGVASELPQPSDLLAKAYAVMHDPTYRQYD